MEEWRDVVGYEDCYEVSNLGQVRSKTRHSVSYGTRLCNRKGKLLKQNPTGHYAAVSLCKNGIIKTRTVHSLVAEAFLPKSNDLTEIDHIDRNKRNNNVSNLRWVTRGQNQENKGIPSHNTSGEMYIQIQYRVCGTKDGIHHQKAFRTLSEAHDYRKTIWGF